MAISKAKADPATREQVDAKLLAVGQAVLEIETTEAEMQREIDAIKERYAPALHLQRTELETRARVLRLAVEDSRSDLFPGKRKTLDLLFGKCGFRAQGLRVKLQDGVDTKHAVRSLRANALDRFVRTTAEINKAAISRALGEDEIQADFLAHCGIRIDDGREDFWYEPDRASVREHTNKD